MAGAMRQDEAAIVAHRLFAAFPESAQVKRDGRKSGTRDEYERFLRSFPRETGDAIVSAAVLRYEWLPKIRHLQLVADEIAGDGSFARLRDRLLATAKWAVYETARGTEGMTVRSFLEGHRRELEADHERQLRHEKDGWLGGVKDRVATEQAIKAIDALLAETDEYGGHRDHGDPIQAALGVEASS